MTDVPSKHVWKIKESRIVFKDFDIIAVVSTFWINYLMIFLNKMRGNPQFSCWISIVLAKICFPRIVINHTKRYVLHDQNSQLAKQEHNSWFSRDVTKILKSKPGGLRKFYLHLRKDYLKMYSRTIP